ncbi:unnamed protein product [Amoebophrya sp. A25]|nr:unnamed protein product [Amoebophrya sp. A25]|eukprot:GSA25T00003140001.1
MFFQLRSSGILMPKLGFGTYRIPPGYVTQEAVATALAHGYRLIDTAALYRNEADVGRAVKAFLTPSSGASNPTVDAERSDIFVTTKLWDSDHGYEQTLAAFEKSAKKLDLDYVDLYLMHSPNRGKLVETWDAMLKLKQEKKVRAIGVSNWNVQHFQLLEKHGRELPDVNQIELHPLNYHERQDVVEYCAKHKIVITAYGSLLSGRLTEMLAGQLGGMAQNTIPIDSGWFTAVQQDEGSKNSTVAQRKEVSIGQMLLRWGLEKGLALIPKSVHEERIVENSRIFDFALSKKGLGILGELRGELNEYWDPLTVRADAGDVSRAES